MIKDNFTNLLNSLSLEELSTLLEKEIIQSNEADFWREKTIPFFEAVLSVLLPLKEQNLLFNPEGKIVEKLDSNLFFRWSDLVCLRILYFIIKQSNEKQQLLRTRYQNKTYQIINIEKLENYLYSNRINISDEDILDFPISIYNLHIGINSIIKNLLK